MMQTLLRTMLTIGGSPAASLIAKATVTAALGLAGAGLARRSRAAVRHALLAAGFAVLLALPVVSIVAPPVRVAVPDRQIAIAASEAPLAAIPIGSAVRPAMAETPPQREISVSALAIPAWIFGAVLSLLPPAISLWKVRALRHRALPWVAGQQAARKLAREAGIGRLLEVMVHEAVPGPMTCGVIHPAIILPPDADGWSADDLERALVHELEHVRRGDWLTHSLARLACALYWFHPLVWMAWRRLGLEAERSCDDAVLRHSEATAYADQLLTLARRLSMTGRSAHLAMANRADLAARVGAVLDAGERRGRAGVVVVALACAAAAIALAVSPLQVVAARQDAAGSLAFDAVSVKLVNTATGMDDSDEHSSPGHLSMVANLHRLIVRAYGIADDQVGGEPEWLKTHLYSIEAVSATRSSLREKMLMLRTALAERFQLELREEEREVPAYALEVAAGGPKFSELAPGETLSHGHAPPGMFEQYFSTMKDFTDSLNRVYGGSLKMDRLVVDRTNLTGNYKIHLLTERQVEDGPSGHRSIDFPNLVHDVQAMGLKLVPTKVMTPYYVVVHAAFPTPN